MTCSLPSALPASAKTMRVTECCAALQYCLPNQRVRSYEGGGATRTYDVRLASLNRPRLLACLTRSAQTCNACVAPRRSFVSAARRASSLCMGWLPRRSLRRASPTLRGNLPARARLSLARSQPRRVQACTVAPHQGNVLVWQPLRAHLLERLCRSSIPRAPRRLGSWRLTTRGQARVRRLRCARRSAA